MNYFHILLLGEISNTQLAYLYTVRPTTPIPMRLALLALFIAHYA